MSSSRMMILLYIVLAPLISVQIRYLTFHYDHVTLWFYRYLCGSLVMIVILALFKRKQLASFLRSWLDVVILGGFAVLGIIINLLYSEGIKYTDTVTASIFGTMLLPVSCLIATILDRERGIDLIRNPIFASSWVVIVLATVGFSLNGNGHGGSQFYLYGILILTINLLFTAIFSYLYKRVLNNHEAWVVGGMTIIVSFAVLSLLQMFRQQGLSTQISNGGRFAFGMLCFSGVYGILVGAGMSSVIMKRVGLIVHRLICLVMPAITAVFAYVFLNEQLTITQLIFGVILLFACYTCLNCRDKKLQEGQSAIQRAS